MSSQPVTYPQKLRGTWWHQEKSTTSKSSANDSLQKQLVHSCKLLFTPFGLFDFLLPQISTPGFPRMARTKAMRGLGIALK